MFFIRDMLVQDPLKRPTSSRLATLLTRICNIEIERYFLVRLSTRNLTLDMVVSTYKFEDPTICVLTALINYKERFNVGPWVA